MSRAGHAFCLHKGARMSENTRAVACEMQMMPCWLCSFQSKACQTHGSSHKFCKRSNLAMASLQRTLQQQWSKVQVFILWLRLSGLPHRMQPSPCWMPAVILHPTNFQWTPSGKAQSMDGRGRLSAGRAFSCSFHLQIQLRICLQKSSSAPPHALQGQQGTWHQAPHRSSQQPLQPLM